MAENSGGVHCLKYGLTLHNVLRVRGLTMEGEIVEFGGDALDAPGLDLLALVIGSEGMLAVITEVTVKLVPTPQAARCIMASFGDVRRRRRCGGRTDRCRASFPPDWRCWIRRRRVWSSRSQMPATIWTPRPCCCASPTARRRKWTKRSRA